MAELSSFMDSEGRLKQFPARRRVQLEAVAWLAEKFEYDREYTQREVNDLIDRWHTYGDPVLLRRELIVGGYLDRTRDGGRYWRVRKEEAGEE